MEKWKDIPGYETLYQASNEGRIRTCEGKTTGNARYSCRIWKQRIMKLKMTTNKKGRSDLRVCLWKDGKEKTWLVSRLVAMTWGPGYSSELTVNHIDGNSLNNNADNLEWVSLKDNIQHGFRTGLYAENQIPVVVVNGNSIELYDSMCSASRALGKNSGYLSNRYNKMRKKSNKGA